ncbi:uncharacterized protein LY89DRAFT_788250 [Mollisia scopiformis]|uniref:Uncharacterized protein n=1 Tax=Mollisia scopiformis TaxID=149040 RepID=A0A132BAS7_MOLSC|nr:uncharacterized protein LY89DRAFT_788250 [Mollisia scopiformis]KUJ09373.1 hypothetical protein LY89DRAFT_788250 [Mollisia scopiformis]
MAASYQATAILTSAFPWEKLPFELRAQVFQEVDRQYLQSKQVSYFKWRLSMPAIVIALRQRPISYYHALQWFAKENTPLIFDLGISCALGDMNDEEAAVITTISMEMSKPLCKNTVRYNKTVWPKSRLQKPVAFTQQFLRLENLREVRLNVGDEMSDSAGFPTSNRAFITEWPFWLEGCKKLSIVEVTVTIKDRSQDELAQLAWRQTERVMVSLVKQISKKLGIEGKKVDMDVRNRLHYISESEGSVWRWEAEEGQFMDWSCELGWWQDSKKNALEGKVDF